MRIAVALANPGRKPAALKSPFPKKGGIAGLSLHKTMPHLRPGTKADGGPISQLAPDKGPPEAAAPGDLQALQESDDNLSPQQGDEKQVVIEAMLALEGRHPHPEEALQAFVEAFGEQALEELKEMMSTQQPGDEEENNGPPPAEPGPAPDEDGTTEVAVGGLLSGPGSGQSDQIEGTTPSGRPVLLSDGEYVIDAPTVAALGDGSTQAGARRLDQFRKAIRSQAYGHDRQAAPMTRGGGGIVVELG